MKSTGGLSVVENNNVVRKVEEDDEMVGRSYGTSFCGPRPRMISAKYRQKEERRKVLKISINKLKKIEDPESSLRRSVLINNTMKRLQREAREEKSQKQQVGGFFDDETGVSGGTGGRTGELADITNLRAKKEEEGSRRGEEVDESDVHAVLSQFYMPLTPRMVTAIDEDEAEAKRPRLEEKAAFSCGHSSMFNELQSVVYHSLIASLET